MNRLVGQDLRQCDVKLVERVTQLAVGYKKQEAQQEAQAVLLTDAGISHAELSAIAENRRPVRRGRAPLYAAARHRAVVDEVVHDVLDVPFLGISRYRRLCTR